MKVCPKCGKKYDDTWQVCMVDDARLVDSSAGVACTANATEPTSALNEFKEGFHFIHYARLFLLVPTLGLAFFLMFGGFQKEYAQKKSLVAALMSYYGLMLILIVVALIAGVYLILKYKKDPTGRQHRKSKAQ